MITRCLTPVLASLLMIVQSGISFADDYASCQPMRPMQEPSDRALPDGPKFYVDPERGDDQAAGESDSPWRTVSHALTQLSPGDTLLLRGGVYFERIVCSVSGEDGAPITIRSHPGEVAIVDGSLEAFQTDSENAWVPSESGVEGKYRSAKQYKNIRDVVGAFGDSMVGLQTYWHRKDLQAENELWIKDPAEEQMVLPVYCGPGLWYDRMSGYVYARLGHTAIKNDEITNYTGETDPRKLPLIIAPFDASPLRISHAAHVRFQDVVFRGGGYNTVVLDLGIDVTFDNVTIYAGTYGIRSTNTGPLRFTDSAIYGNIPPWAFRDENSLFTYSKTSYDPFVPSEENKNRRNIARLNTHALIVNEGGYEFDVFFYPFNHDWEIDHSEFTDAHDGIYAAGQRMRLHHNYIANIQDDAIYLSAPQEWHNDDVHVYRNYLHQVGMAFGTNGWGGSVGKIYIYRNIADLRLPVNWNRPTPENPGGRLFTNTIFLMHGRNQRIESMYVYQNTFIAPADRNEPYLHRWATAQNPVAERWVFNNLMVYLNTFGYVRRDHKWLKAKIAQFDGNLHWSPSGSVEEYEQMLSRLDKLQSDPSMAEHKEAYPSGWANSSIVADPKFAEQSDGSIDYRLSPESAAIDAGVKLPADWKDFFPDGASEHPDIGALPLDAEPLRVGRFSRHLTNGPVITDEPISPRK